MADTRTSSRGSAGQRRHARFRERGMRSASRFTRIAVAASLALSAVFSAVAALGFTGRQGTTSTGDAAGSASARRSSDAQRVALPPTDDEGALSPPFAPPISAPVQAPPVTSGGS